MIGYGCFITFDGFNDLVSCAVASDLGCCNSCCATHIECFGNFEGCHLNAVGKVVEFASIIVNNSMGDAVKPSDDAVTIRFNAVLLKLIPLFNKYSNASCNDICACIGSLNINDIKKPILSTLTI